jgi:hypothetical protein
MNSAAKRWARVGLAQDVHGFLLLMQNALQLQASACTSNLHNQQTPKVKITQQTILILTTIKIV